MARKKSINTKAKELGIDLNKETLGSLLDRLHTCQNGGNGKASVSGFRNSKAGRTLRKKDRDVA